MWRSGLAHLVWDQRVLCSSHSTPTQEENQNGFPLFYIPFSRRLFPSASPWVLFGLCFWNSPFPSAFAGVVSPQPPSWSFASCLTSVHFFLPPPQSISFICIRLGRLSSAFALVFCFLPHSQSFSSSLRPSLFYQSHNWSQKRQRPRRARFCEPAVPQLTKKSPLRSLRRKQSSFVSITCASNVPHKYF